jgi:D-ribose pyranose/furanose isomerase RbsD
MTRKGRTVVCVVDAGLEVERDDVVESLAVVAEDDEVEDVSFAEELVAEGVCALVVYTSKKSSWAIHDLELDVLDFSTLDKISSGPSEEVVFAVAAPFADVVAVFESPSVEVEKTAVGEKRALR